MAIGGSMGSMGRRDNPRRSLLGLLSWLCECDRRILLLPPPLAPIPSKSVGALDSFGFSLKVCVPLTIRSLSADLGLAFDTLGGGGSSRTPTAERSSSTLADITSVLLTGLIDTLIFRFEVSSSESSDDESKVLD